MTLKHTYNFQEKNYLQKNKTISVMLFSICEKKVVCSQSFNYKVTCNYFLNTYLT